MPTEGDLQLTAGFELRDESRKDNSYAMDLSYLSARNNDLQRDHLGRLIKKS